MKPVNSGLTIPWEDFNHVLREEQIFHAQYCPAKKDACLGVWLDRWCYCDSYVVANMAIERRQDDESTDFSSRQVQTTIT
jgi:hypothetical protein